MNRTTSCRQFSTIALAIIIALFALEITADFHIDLENLAKGKDNTSIVETTNNKPYTAHTIKDIKNIILEKSRETQKGVDRVIWLGFSQLHYINQYQFGDHLSPYWLRKGLRNTDVLGFSLPSADIQEYLILSKYTIEKIPVNLMVVTLVFDKLREDGLRCDFSDLLDAQELNNLQKDNSSVTVDILRRYQLSCLAGEEKPNMEMVTIQQRVEQSLNKKLSASWSLWAERPRIEGNVVLSLYYFRNWMFGINPTTIRKKIPARYDRNMNALREMLAYMNHRRIPVLLYIAPIRQDSPIPYDRNEYEQWKEEVTTLSQAYGDRVINLEQIVPGKFWGSYHANDLDFMHFRGEGHKILANALLPYVKKILVKGNH